MSRGKSPSFNDDDLPLSSPPPRQPPAGASASPPVTQPSPPPVYPMPQPPVVPQKKSSTGCVFIAVALVVLGIIGIIVAASFQNSIAAGNMTLSSDVGNPLVHVGPNPSACTGSFAGADSGVVNVHLDNNGNSLNMSVHDALPNTTYVVDIRCVGAIGTFSTNSEGIGTASLDLPSTLPTTFYIDVEVPPPGGAGFGGYGDSFIAGPFSNSKTIQNGGSLQTEENKAWSIL